MYTSICIALYYDGNWTTLGYANSRIANSRTGHLADWSTRALVNSRTGQVTDWTTRGLTDAAKRTKTKHTKSPVASSSCPVLDLSSPRDVQSASRPVRELAIRELSSNHYDSSLKRSGMARVNEGSHSFSYLPPTRLCTSGMNHTCLYFPAAEHHRTLADTHFPSR